MRFCFVTFKIRNYYHWQIWMVSTYIHLYSLIYNGSLQISHAWYDIYYNYNSFSLCLVRGYWIELLVAQTTATFRHHRFSQRFQQLHGLKGSGLTTLSFQPAIYHLTLYLIRLRHQEIHEIPMFNSSSNSHLSVGHFDTNKQTKKLKLKVLTMFFSI